MEYTDWLWIKFIVVCVAAFVHGFWTSFTGEE